MEEASRPSTRAAFSSAVPHLRRFLAPASLDRPEHLHYSETEETVHTSGYAIANPKRTEVPPGQSPRQTCKYGHFMKNRWVSTRLSAVLGVQRRILMDGTKLVKFICCNNNTLCTFRTSFCDYGESVHAGCCQGGPSLKTGQTTFCPASGATSSGCLIYTAAGRTQL